MNDRAAYQIIDSSQYGRVPWKNGRGETLAIVSHEDEKGIRFRISQAAVVENGVFSDFTGLHRTLVLLSDSGMTLTHERHEQRTSSPLLNALDMALFDGGDLTSATLHQGPIEDLNIMVRKQDTQATLKAIYREESVCIRPLQEPLLQAFYATQLCHLSYVADQAVEHIDLLENSILILSAAGVLTVEQGGGVFIDISDL